MKKTGYFLLAVIVIVAAAGVGYWKFSGNPDALREIVLEQCLPDQLQHQNPAPCAKSNLALATQRNLLTLNRASAEEIQDHQCEILK